MDVKKCSNNESLTNEKFIHRSKNIHGDRYDYSSVKYINNNSKVKIYCKKCNKHFLQRPYSHLNGSGCPICNESKGEKIISNILDSNNIKYIREYKFIDCKNIRALPFDFYAPDLNLCIEYDGKQHFESKSIWGGDKEFKLIKIKDNIKTTYCIDNNIEILRISYKEKIMDKISIFFMEKFKLNL